MSLYFLHFIYIAFINVVETAAYMLLFTNSLKRRPHFAIRLAVYFLVALFVSAIISSVFYLIWAHLREFSTEDPILLVASLVIYFSAFAMSLGMLFFCFDEGASILIYVTVVSKATMNVSSAIYNLIMTATGNFTVYVALIDKGNVLTWLLYFIIHAVCLFLCWMVFVRRFPKYKNNISKNLNVYVTVLFVTVLLAMVIFEGCISIYGGLGDLVKYIFYSMQILLSITILLVELFILSWIREFQEKNMIADQYESYKRQSEKTRQNMEIINIKCHDLKHQIGKVLSANNVDAGYVKEVQDAVRIYDTNIFTGYEELDLILMEKSAYCEVNKIQLSVMIDGSALKFMSVGDISSFFGNALDNAIEYLLTVDEKDRFIRVSSSERGDLFTVRIENFFSGNIELDNKGFPVTSKGDFVNHGFGVRSIKSIAEKYGGVVSFKAEGGLFVLSAGFFERH